MARVNRISMGTPQDATLLGLKPYDQRRYNLAQAMKAKGTSTAPVDHWLQGLARVVQGGMGGYQTQQIEQEADDRRQAMADTMNKALTPESVPPESIRAPGFQPRDESAYILDTLGENEDLRPMVMRARLAQAMAGPVERKVRPDAYGVPRYQGTGEAVYKGDEGFDPNVISPEAMAQEVKKRQAGRSLVSQSVGAAGPGPSAFTRKLGEGEGKAAADYFAGVRSSASDAGDTLRRISRTRHLLSQVNTGKLEPAKQWLKANAKGLGINLANWNMEDNVGVAEAIQSAATLFAMDFIKNTKGAISEKEMALFAQASIGLDRSPEGNALILEMAEDAAQRTLAINKMNTDFMRQHKGNPTQQAYAEFQSKLAAWHLDNPFMTQDRMAIIERLTTDPADAVTPVETVEQITVQDAESMSTNDLRQLLRNMRAQEAARQ